MTRTGIIVAFFLFFSLNTNTSYAQYGFVQFEGQAETVGFVPAVHLLVGGEIVETSAGSFGIEGFSLVTDGWAEGYVGPTWSPVPEIFIGVFAGMETGPETLPRFATEVIVNYEWFSFFGAVEFNSDSFDGEQIGLWYKVVAAGQATEWFKLGIEWRKFAGLGPHIDVTIPNTPLEFWVSWIPIEPETLDGSIVHWDRFLFGGRVNF